MNEPAGDLQGSRILVVEDQYFVAADLCRALQQSGAKVLGPVPDLDGGLVLARGEQLDAAVLDVNLGGEMSFSIADVLVGRDVPFLFATGYEQCSLPIDYRRAIQLDKPFDSRSVVAALKELLDPARLSTEPR